MVKYASAQAGFAASLARSGVAALQAGGAVSVHATLRSTNALMPGWQATLPLSSACDHV